MNQWPKSIPLRQIPELDTIRFLSIVLVVLHHQFFDQNLFLAWFKNHGWVGVDIFFVMSGFLITGLLIKEQEKTNTINLKLFWMKRMLRLWPSWLLTLGLSFLMVFVISRNNLELRSILYERWWHYFLHFGNYSHALVGKLHTLYSHFWSLAVEEHFYFLWPMILVFVKRKKTLIWTIIFLILVPLALRYFHLYQGHHKFINNLSTHTRVDEILFGCLLSFYFPKFKDLTAIKELILTMLMFLLFGISLYMCKANEHSVILNGLTYTLNGLASCLLIIIALKGGNYGLRRLFRCHLLAKLGVLSYGVYLIHFHANFLVFSLLSKFQFIQDQNVIAMVNLLLPFIPAYLMYFYVDEYFAKFKSKIKHEKNH